MKTLIASCLALAMLGAASADAQGIGDRGPGYSYAHDRGGPRGHYQHRYRHRPRIRYCAVWGWTWRYHHRVRYCRVWRYR